MTRPLVSVLCVTYNQREFVSETLAGVLSQDYPNLEVVIADDGSSDGTVELLHQLAADSTRPVTIITGPHVGITGNSNRGLERCRGRYIAITGGDDVLLPAKITRQVNWMEADERRVLCGHDVDVFDSATGAILYRWSERIPPESGVGAERAVQSVPFCATAIMVRRSAIPSYGFDPRIATSSDWKLWIDCLYPDGIYGYVDGVLARYRRHTRNVTGSADMGRTEHLLREQLLIWDIVAREHPSLARACRRAREDAYLVAAKVCRQQGRGVQAAVYLGRALMTRPLHSIARIAGFAQRHGAAALSTAVRS